MYTFATVQTSVGYVIVFLVFLAAVAYALTNLRAGRREVGSEVYTAPNRKLYYPDAILETKRLDRLLTMAFGTLAIVSIVLPLYWLREPGRKTGAVNGQNATFLKEGEDMFNANTPENPNGLGCAGCHGVGGTGGSATYTITDSDGRFLQQVTWQAPALNTATLRFSRSDIRYIIDYGRPFSPMAAWGVVGGGPLDVQSVEDLTSYLQSIQLTPKQSQSEVAKGLAAELAAAKTAGHPYTSTGQALFNLGYYSQYAGGAFSCGRCHTQGWSYGQKAADGTGAYGPNLTDTTAQFPGSTAGDAQMLSFVCQGSVQGATYGVHGLGTGRMPAFCQSKAYDPNTDLDASQPDIAKQDQGAPGSGMMTQAEVALIVNYVRGL